jgi:hypothetical protein
MRLNSTSRVMRSLKFAAVLACSRFFSMLYSCHSLSNASVIVICCGDDSRAAVVSRDQQSCLQGEVPGFNCTCAVAAQAVPAMGQQQGPRVMQNIYTLIG